MKEAYARDTKGKQTLNCYGVYKEDIALITNNYLFLVPEDKCYLKFETVFRKPPVRDVNKILEGDFKPIEDTNEITIKVKNGKQYRLHKFKLDNEYIYINDDYLKKFKCNSPKFEGIGPKSIVLVYEYGYLVGGILPLNINYFD